MTSLFVVVGRMAIRGRLNLKPTSSSGVAIPGWSPMSMSALFVVATFPACVAIYTVNHKMVAVHL